MDMTAILLTTAATLTIPTCIVVDSLTLVQETATEEGAVAEALVGAAVAAIRIVPAME